MKKLIIIFLILSNINIYSQETSQRYINAQSGLRLRNEPSFNGIILTTIPYNEMVIIFGENSDEIIVDNISGRWTRVIYNNFVGWVFNGYLTERNSQRRLTNITQGYLYENIKKEFSLEGFPRRPEQVINAKILINSNNTVIETIFTNENLTDVIRNTIINPPIRTYRGIGVGDNIGRIIELYPNAERYQDNFYWGISFITQDHIINYIGIRFFYSGNIITRIEINYSTGDLSARS